VRGDEGEGWLVRAYHSSPIPTNGAEVDS